MTLCAPQCSCDWSLGPPSPCSLHGTRENRDKLARTETENKRLTVENKRLRELYENVVINRQQFGFTINHLLEADEAFRMAEADNARLREALHDIEQRCLSVDSLAPCAPLAEGIAATATAALSRKR